MNLKAIFTNSSPRVIYTVLIITVSFDSVILPLYIKWVQNDKRSSAYWSVVFIDKLSFSPLGELILIIVYSINLLLFIWALTSLYFIFKTTIFQVSTKLTYMLSCYRWGLILLVPLMLLRWIFFLASWLHPNFDYTALKDLGNEFELPDSNLMLIYYLGFIGFGFLLVILAQLFVAAAQVYFVVDLAQFGRKLHSRFFYGFAAVFFSLFINYFIFVPFLFIDLMETSSSSPTIHIISGVFAFFIEIASIIFLFSALIVGLILLHYLRDDYTLKQRTIIAAPVIIEFIIVLLIQLRYLGLDLLKISFWIENTEFEEWGSKQKQYIDDTKFLVFDEVLLELFGTDIGDILVTIHFFFFILLTPSIILFVFYRNILRNTKPNAPVHQYLTLVIPIFFIIALQPPLTAQFHLVLTGLFRFPLLWVIFFSALYILVFELASKEDIEKTLNEFFTTKIRFFDDTGRRLEQQEIIEQIDSELKVLQSQLKEKYRTKDPYQLKSEVSAVLDAMKRVSVQEQDGKEVGIEEMHKYLHDITQIYGARRKRRRSQD